MQFKSDENNIKKNALNINQIVQSITNNAFSSKKNTNSALKIKKKSFILEHISTNESLNIRQNELIKHEEKENGNKQKENKVKIPNLNGIGKRNTWYYHTRQVVHLLLPF